MKVFMTGATGFIGNAVARALRRSGHEVSGLARSEDKAKALWREEVRPVLGDLRKPESYAGAARDAEVVIHAAAELGKDMSDLDRQTVERLLGAVKDAKLPRTFIYTSGCWVYGNTGMEKVTEGTARKPLPLVAWRPAHEDMVLAATSGLVATSVIRPGCVYGGRGSLTSMWFESAEKEGAARIVGEGNNRWAMIHREDLADAYARVIEKRVRGESFNLADRSRYTVREMASAASRAAGKSGEVRLTPLADAAKVMPPPFAEALAVDQHLDAWKAVQVLGWNPRFGGFVDDADLYYRAWKAQRD
jgi:nucleoside-diphosphate-sugar epimerase